MLLWSAPLVALLAGAGLVIRVSAGRVLDGQNALLVPLFLAAAAAPVLLRISGGRTVPVLLLFATGVLDVVYTCADEGGVHSPTTGWLPVVAFLSAFLGDLRTSIALGALSIAALTGLAAAEGAGLLPRPPHLDPVDTLEDWITTTWAVVFAVLLASIQERAVRLSFERTEHAYRRLADLLGGLPDPVLRIGSDGRVQSVSRPPGWSRPWPAPLDGASADIGDCFPPELADPLRQQITSALAGEATEREHTAAEGPSHVWILVRADRLGRDEAVVTVRDMTDRRLLERRVRVGEQLATLGTMAAMVGHELNNPLAAARANLSFALEQLGDAPTSVRGSLADAAEATERAAVIAGDLRALARPSASDVPFDAGEVVRQALRLVRHGLDHRTRVRTELAPVPAVRGDPGKLVQVVVNLLTNAARAMPEGRTDNLVSVRLHTSGGTVEITVADNGRGMPPDRLRQAFDPFFTEGPWGGLGLGLAICREAVEAMHGTIEVHSTEGAGTTFRVRLPASVPAPAPPPPAPVRWRDVAAGLDLLLVDDDPTVTAALSRALSSARVRVVPDLQRVLDQIRESPPDVVLCDVMLHQTTGPDVYEAVRAAHPALADRFVFISGGVFSERARTFFESHALPLLHKPLDPAGLAEAIAGLRRDPEG